MELTPEHQKRLAEQLGPVVRKIINAFTRYYRPIPKYPPGRPPTPDGFAIVGDDNREEIILSTDGRKFGISSKQPTVLQLKERLQLLYRKMGSTDGTPDADEVKIVKAECAAIVERLRALEKPRIHKP